MKKKKITKCTVYSCELAYRIRFVYEYYKGEKIIYGVKYDSLIDIIDCGNHEHRGQSYAEIFSDVAE